MKVLIVNPNSDFLINEKVFPSLGLLYLSAYLKMNGYNDISLVDMNGENALPASVDADVVGVYSNTPQFPTAVRLISRVRQINIAKDPVYVLGGPHVSGKPEDGMPESDVVVVWGRGEGVSRYCPAEGAFGAPRQGHEIRLYQRDRQPPFP